MITLLFMMKRIFIFTVSMLFTAGMVFGIGLNPVKAVLPAEQSSAAATNETQPASGADMYKAVENGSAEIVGMETADAAEAVETENHGAETEADAGIVGMFGLNWKLFLAQLINFGIILFVLWKWVFGPVTKGLADRTSKIESGLAEAQKLAEERKTFESWKQGEISQVRTEAAGILTEAKQTAEKLKSDTISETKAEQEKVIASAQKKLEQEKSAMLENVRGELAGLVVQATEAVIKQKLDPKKDSALIEEALKAAQGGMNEI